MSDVDGDRAGHPATGWGKTTWGKTSGPRRGRRWVIAALASAALWGTGCDGCAGCEPPADEGGAPAEAPPEAAPSELLPGAVDEPGQLVVSLPKPTGPAVGRPAGPGPVFFGTTGSGLAVLDADGFRTVALVPAFVLDMALASDGTLWMTSGDQVFSLAPGASEIVGHGGDVISKFIGKVTVDAEGAVWVQGADAIGKYLDEAWQRWDLAEILPDATFSGDYARGIHMDASGVLYLAHRKHLAARAPGDTGAWAVSPLPIAQGDMVLSDGAAYSIGETGLMRWDGESHDGLFMGPLDPRVLREQRERAAAAAGDVEPPAASGGADAFDGPKSHEEAGALIEEMLQDPPPSEFLPRFHDIDRQGHLHVGSWDEVRVFAPGGGPMRRFERGSEELPGRTVMALAADGSGRTWAAHDGGLSVLAPDGTSVTYLLGSVDALRAGIRSILAVGDGPAELPAMSAVRTAAIEGLIKGPMGAPVPGAKVEACPEPDLSLPPFVSPCAASAVRGRTMTDASGRYRLEDMPVGNYALTWTVGEGIWNLRIGACCRGMQPGDIFPVEDISLRRPAPRDPPPELP